MRKTYLIIILSLITNYNYSQNEYINKLLLPEFSEKELKPENYIKNYSNYDFSTLLVPKHRFIGYIGSNYRKIDIYFTSINKNPLNPTQYTIKGKSVVNNNICDFSGEIFITQIREYKTIDLGVDKMYEPLRIKNQSVIIANYSLKENPNQKNSGIFKGVMAMYFFMNRNGILQYDQINSNSDGFCNNQYYGTWENYSKNTSKTCNWGELRIPKSGDLDIGAGEFSPNPKYNSVGWENYISY